MKKCLLILPIIFGFSAAFGMDTQAETAPKGPDIIITRSSDSQKTIVVPVISIALSSESSGNPIKPQKAAQSGSQNLLTPHYNPYKITKKPNFEKDPFAPKKPKAKTTDDL